MECLRVSTIYSRTTVSPCTNQQRSLKQIFFCLLQFHNQNFVPSHFLHQHFLPVFTKERFLRECWVQLHSFKNSMPSSDAAEESLRQLFASKEKSSSSAMQSVVDAFQTAHALYWLCCEQGESVSAFDFLDIGNPLVEHCDQSRYLRTTKH